MDKTDKTDMLNESTIKMRRMEKLSNIFETRIWVFKVLFSVFFTYMACSVIIPLIIHSKLSGFLPKTGVMMIASFGFQGSLLLVVLAATILFKPEWSIRRKLLLRRWRFSYVAEAIGVELVVVPAIAVLTLDFSIVMEIWGYTPDPPPVMKYLSDCDALGFVVIGVTAVLLAPLTEELIFRRLLFIAAKPLIGVAGAWGFTSILFGVIHQSVVQFAAFFVLGLVMQGLYLRHKSIYASMVFHMIHNGVSLGMLLLLRTAGYIG